MKKQLTLFAFCGLAMVAVAADFTPTRLQAEHLDNPSVLDTAAPRLSWVNSPGNSTVTDAKQTSYRIVASSSARKLAAGDYDLWDSGRRNSDNSYLVRYEGKTPGAGGDCYWKVATWDGNGESTGWSETAHWGLGPTDSTWTQSKWIGAPWQTEVPRKLSGAPTTPAPMLRTEFDMPRKPVKAKIYVTGLGFFELYINGKKVGEDKLVPNLTNYTARTDLDRYPIVIHDKFSGSRVMYLAYDVTDQLRSGRNAIGAMVGNGFYDTLWAGDSPFGTPRFLCRLEIEYSDGSRQTVVSDETWRAYPSPIVLDGPFEGEIYDAGLETRGWDKPGFDDSKWQYAALRNAPDGKLCAHAAPTDRVTKTYSPKSLRRNADGSWEVQFPEEISGWIRLKNLKVNAGDTIDISFISETRQGVERYIADKSGRIDYAPRFTWFAFAGAVIRGVDDLKVSNLVAEAVNTDVASTGRFISSIALLDSINHIWRRSQLDNMHGGIASDCPHRERAPYTGDGQVSMNTVMSNFDVAAFYRKWMRDMRDAQDEKTGYVPNGAPWQPTCGGGPAWGAAMNIMPWEYYVQYGDTAVLAENYDAMKAQADYMRKWETSRGTMDSKRASVNDPEGKPMYWLNLGDWCSPGELPSQELVHSFYYWLCLHNTSLAAKVLGHELDAIRYGRLADNVRDAVIYAFYDKDKGTFGDFGANVFALQIGMPDSIQTRIADDLAREVAEVHGGHLHTGIFGTRYLFEQLASTGHNDIAFNAMTKRDFPSYGHWLAQGATVTWENWNGNDSHNHPMFGGGLTWLYNRLAGVEALAESPGFKRFRVKPVPWGGDGTVAYEYDSPYGLVRSEVSYNGSSSELKVTVPVGAKAEVWLPVLKGAQGRPEGDSSKWRPSPDGAWLVTEVGQGSHTFRAL